MGENLRACLCTADLVGGCGREPAYVIAVEHFEETKDLAVREVGRRPQLHRAHMTKSEKLLCVCARVWVGGCGREPVYVFAVEHLDEANDLAVREVGRMPQLHRAHVAQGEKLLSVESVTSIGAKALPTDMITQALDPRTENRGRIDLMKRRMHTTMRTARTGGSGCVDPF